MNLNTLYTGCRTYRRFFQKPVPDALLRCAMENARIASSAANRQILRYVVVTEPSNVASIQPHVHWAGYLPPEEGVPKENELPTAFIAVFKEKGGSDIDVGIAVNTIVTTLWESGVGSCIMGAIDRPALCGLLQEDPKTELSLMIALGYPSHESRVIPMTDSIRYSLDKNRDYLVPKRAFDEIVAWR